MKVAELRASLPELFGQMEINPNLLFNEKFREFGILIDDGGSSYWCMNYCPWSGQQLPASLRDVWFQKIWEMGFDSDDDRIPEKFLGASWWEESQI